MKGEPDWLIDQLLRRKRQELVQRFEDREKRLEAIRQREKSLEGRSSKRRRIERSAAATEGEAVDDEEAEWLLKDWEGHDNDESHVNALSGLSKESREVLAGFGLDRPSNQHENSDDVMEEDVKVRFQITTLRESYSDLGRSTTPQERIPSCHSLSASSDDLDFRHHCLNLWLKTAWLPRLSSYFPSRRDRSSA